MVGVTVEVVRRHIQVADFILRPQNLHKQGLLHHQRRLQHRLHHPRLHPVAPTLDHILLLEQAPHPHLHTGPHTAHTAAKTVPSYCV